MRGLSVQVGRKRLADAAKCAAPCNKTLCYYHTCEGRMQAFWGSRVYSQPDGSRCQVGVTTSSQETSLIVAVVELKRLRKQKVTYLPATLDLSFASEQWRL